MTTPQVPANTLRASDVSDEINPAGYVQGQQDIGGNNSIRQLASKPVPGSELLFSDLSNKTAFSEIIAVSSNTQSGIMANDVPITSEIVLQANSDMLSPSINWQYTIDGGSVGVTASDITVTTPTNKSAVVKLSSISGSKTANLTITGVMSVDGHTINTCSKNILLTVNSVNTNFQVTASPSFTANSTGLVAQTAVVVVSASSNSQLSGITYRFTPTFVSGTGSLTPIVGPNSIAFNATAATPLTNAAVYSVLTEMLENGRVVRTNVSTVDIKAQFIQREITSLVPAALSNNQFSNSLSQYSTIDVIATHNSQAPLYPQGSVTFTLETIGDTVTQQTLSSNTTANVERISLYYDKDANGFGFKKATVVVVATLRSPDNIVLDQKRSQPITLRAGTYGLTLNKPPSNTQIGFSAQTATSIGSATWGAGDFAWSVRQFGGSGPELIQDNQPRASTISIRATTASGKNASQTVSNASNYDITASLTYDGVTVVNTVLSDIQISAQSQPYTYSISPPPTSNVQMEVSAVAAARVVISASKSTGTIQWTRDNTNVDLQTNPTSALVEVNSPVNGGANTQTVVVTGSLLDGSSRLIEALSTPAITLDAATSRLTITGSDTVRTSNNRTDSVTGVFETAAVIGNHQFRFPPVKKSGNDLALALLENSQRLSITASATQTSNTGTYELTGEVNYKGVIRTTKRDVTVGITAIAPSLTVTKYPASWSTYSSVGGFGGIGLPGSGGGFTYVVGQHEDIIVESDYPGTINVDYTIRRVINRVGKFGEADTVEVTGPFYNEAANTSAAPAGFPSSVNKRRDRVTLIPFIGTLLDYDFTYELYDASGRFLRDLRVSTGILVPKPGAVTSLTQDNVTAKTYAFTNKPSNVYGYPEPHPLEVEYQQRVDLTSTFTSETSIPVPRFVFAAKSDNAAANVVIVSNSINGQANITVKSVYYDPSANKSGTLPTTTESTGTLNVSSQLTSTDQGQTYSIGNPASVSTIFALPMPPGRCYRLSTFTHENRGPRMQHTRDVYGNTNEQLDYGRIPSLNSLNGPETKWIGFHSQTNTFVGHQGGYGQLYDPNASTSRPRPLYGLDRNKTRYYSSNAHRNFFNESPGVVIPNNYFMVMSFGETGTPFIGQVTLIGSDNNAYVLGVNDIWVSGSQNDTARNNDAFNWYIFKFTPPPGVTFEYVFISNVAKETPPPPPPADALVFTAAQPGNALVGDSVNLNIGTVTGGVIQEDRYVDPGNTGGGIRDTGNDFDFSSINY